MNPEKVEELIGLVARFVISLIMPAWGLAMLALGLIEMSPWWIGCGAVVSGVGALLLVGNPMVWPAIREL